MTTLREAAEMALAVLEQHVNQKTFDGGVRISDAAIALREALAQPEPEPVAWMYEWDGKRHLTFTDQRFIEKLHPHFNKSSPLYTHPPQQQAAPFSPDSISTAQTAWKMGYEAAKAEIAEQPEQKPVAVVVAAEYEDGSHAGHRLEWRGRNEANDYPEGTEFYTAPPPQRKPLTNEEILKMWDDTRNDPIAPSVFCLIACVRHVERAHGIGGEE